MMDLDFYLIFLMQTENVSITSTFQGLIVLYTREQVIAEKYVMTFTSKLLHSSIYTVTEFKVSLLILPAADCTKTLCSIFIATELEYQINVTAISILTANPYDFNCLYAGIVVGETFTNEYKESKTVCTNNVNSLSDQSFSFYSSNSSLILVMFWYKGYNNINASLKISVTQCKPILIDLCVLHLFCVKTENCTSYLKVVRAI